jgi:hypothetical protein
MGRRDLTERTSWDDAHGAVAYTADALALAGEDGDKAVGALAGPTEKLLKSWETLDIERRARRRAVGKAHALVRRRDMQADKVVIDLHNDVLSAVKQDRDTPLFRRLFPDPLSTVVRMSLESELPELRALSLKLAEEETPGSLRKAHTKALDEAIKQGETAVRAREEAFAAAGRTSARIAAWREDANAVLLGVEGALKQIASQRKLDTDWVDAFFPAAERGKAKKKDGPVADPAAPGAPAPGAPPGK